MSWTDWILEEDKRDALTWLGGGLMVFVGGAWKYYTWKHPKPKDDKPATLPTQSATANNGGTAVNVSGENNQIHIGK